MAFSLIDECWIPIIQDDGTIRDVGLREALVKAHTFQGISDPLPTTEFGLHRLLVAFILDIFQPEDTLALAEILSAGQFDSNTIDRYFARYGDRFDLFDAQHPFLQSPGMMGEDKPLAGLLHPLPSGTGSAHFHHGHEDAFGVSPAVTARLLTTLAPFMTAGGAGLSPSINGAPPWYVLVNGKTLFQTLCLNTYVMDLPGTQGQTAPPAWRDERPLASGRSTGASLAESLTWRPRRILLVPGEEGQCSVTGENETILVRTMKFGPGASCDFLWRDPSVPYRVDDKGVRVLRPQEGREVWRDTGPMTLLNRNEAGFARPLLVDQFANLITNGYLPKREALSITLYGMRTDLKMKIFEWRREALSTPLPLVLNNQFHTIVQAEMDRANEVARALKSAIKLTYPREGKGNKAAFAVLISHAERDYWHALRGSFQALLEDLSVVPAAQSPQVETVRQMWHTHLRQISKKLFETTVGQLDTDAAAMCRQVNAAKDFHRKCHFIFATDEEKAASAARRKKKGEDT